MSERRLPRVFEGFSTLVRKLCRLCGVGQRQFVGCERVWRDHRFVERKLAADTVVPAAQTSAPLRSEGGRIEQAIGGFDISANEHVNSKFAPHWRPHAWFFVSTKDPNGLKGMSQKGISCKRAGETASAGCPVRLFTNWYARLPYRELQKLAVL